MAHEAPPRYTLTVHDALTGRHGYSPDLPDLDAAHRWLDVTLGAPDTQPRPPTPRETNAAQTYGLNRLQAAVLASVTKEPGHTGAVILRFPNNPPSSIRGRLKQLVDLGHLTRGKDGTYRAAKRQP